jgi:hypothetical protein
MPRNSPSELKTDGGGAAPLHRVGIWWRELKPPRRERIVAQPDALPLRLWARAQPPGTPGQATTCGRSIAPHLLAFAILMLTRFVALIAEGA